MLNVTILEGVFQPGDQIRAQTSMAGVVTIESDFNQSSQSMNLTGVNSVDLGPISRPGAYYVRFLQGGNRTQFALLATPTASGRLALSVSSDGGPAPVPQDLLTRFAAAFTRARAEAAAASIAGTWLGAHSTAIGGVAICLVVGAALESAPTLIECAKAGTSEATDFALSLMIEMTRTMRVDNVITEHERVVLTTFFSTANIRLSHDLSGDDFDRLLSGISAAGDQIFENEDAKVAWHLTIDFVKKFYFIIQLRELVPLAATRRRSLEDDGGLAGCGPSGDEPADAVVRQKE